MLFLRHLDKFCSGRVLPCRQSILYSAVRCQLSLKAVVLHPSNSKSRSFSSTLDTEREKRANGDFMELYLFEKIRYLRLLGRLSKVSCLSLFVGAPTCVLSSFSHLMSFETSNLIIAILAFYSTIFTGQSFLFSSRIIGKLMINDGETLVKISYLSLFGNRKDIFIEPSNIVPFADVTYDVFEKKMAVVTLKNSKKKLLFLPGMGGIDTNFEALELILSGGLSEKK